MHVTIDTVVSMRYVMKNGNGEVLENTMNNDPVNYLHGSADILPLLQSQLEGLQAGDKKSLLLQAASGFTSEDFIFEVIIDDVRAASKEEILLGYPVKINVAKCETDCECYG